MDKRYNISKVYKNAMLNLFKLQDALEERGIDPFRIQELTLYIQDAVTILLIEKGVEDGRIKRD